MDYTQQYAERNYEDNSSLATNYPNYTIFSDRSNIMVQPSYNSSSLIMNENNAMEDGSRSLTVRSPTSWQDRHPRDISHKITHHANTSGRGIAGFVSKLYQCLQPNSKNQKYARWCEHDGKDMFIIDCIPEFTEVVLPGLFKHCKFPSFVRQLNIYGFQRDTDARKTKDTRDKESCRWYHPYFRPDRRDLFHLIRRKASRSKMAKQEDRDPDTIIYCQEDENEEEDIVQSDRIESSASSVTHHSSHIVEYNSSSCQSQPEYQESNKTPLLHLPLNNLCSLPSQSESLTSDSHPLHEESDKGSTGQLTTFPHYSQDDQVAREQLHLQIYNMESQYERMQKQFDEQLRTSRKQIQEQQARIDHLECVLGMSKQNMKQTSPFQSGGYIHSTPTLSHTYSGSHFLPPANTHRNSVHLVPHNQHRGLPLQNNKNTRKEESRPLIESPDLMSQSRLLFSNNSRMVEPHENTNNSSHSNMHDNSLYNNPITTGCDTNIASTNVNHHHNKTPAEQNYDFYFTPHTTSNDKMIMQLHDSPSLNKPTPKNTHYLTTSSPHPTSSHWLSSSFSGRNMMGKRVSISCLPSTEVTTEAISADNNTSTTTTTHGISTSPTPMMNHHILPSNSLGIHSNDNSSVHLTGHTLHSGSKYSSYL